MSSGFKIWAQETSDVFHEEYKFLQEFEIQNKQKSYWRYRIKDVVRKLDEIWRKMTEEDKIPYIEEYEEIKEDQKENFPEISEYFEDPNLPTEINQNSDFNCPSNYLPMKNENLEVRNKRKYENWPEIDPNEPIFFNLPDGPEYF
ncbi:hypothetical protein L5515_015835 [Caenorhabditis briggsae]|uniref:HMG box domain-containing protein n=1 Tax=Caenorhabditis briggsae TaxID=6238 RepID=A0AAE9J999_CAEBR|nr:hypothetical protein L5515_015835 [Caenorhabditis briggsae]